MSRGSACLFGAHTIDNGGVHMALRRAGAAGMQAVQIFTAPPTYYNERIGVRPERLARFRAALEASGIPASHVLVHAGYVVNPATPDEAKWTRAAAALAKELERSATLGVGAVCFHPGSAGSGGWEPAVERVATAITRALEQVDTSTRLLVENTAGAGQTVGRTAEEVGGILAHVPPALRARTGYGLDTCHLFASGHDITPAREALTGVLDAFERAAGEPPAFFHLNDSEGALGSNRDRHALLGEGKIGVEPFRWLVQDRRARGIPLVLETPQANPDVAEDDATPDAWDVQMMRLLESLAAPSVG